MKLITGPDPNRYDKITYRTHNRGLPVELDHCWCQQLCRSKSLSMRDRRQAVEADADIEAGVCSNAGCLPYQIITVFSGLGSGRAGGGRITRSKKKVSITMPAE